MTDLQTAAAAIEAQLNKSTTLFMGITYTASNGGIAEIGTMDQASIDAAMVDQYNSAIDTVLATSYLNAQEMFLNEHQNAMANLDVAIDNLVSATSVLATVTTVADMAAGADTTQEQLQVQAALATTDMSISQADVDNYNSALTGVETMAQQAGAFLAAANNASMTSAIDSFAATNNFAVGNYTSVSYSVSVDQMVVQWNLDGYGMSFDGALANDFVTGAEVYNAGMIYGGS